MLRIGEAGLNNLVNKHIRERVEKQENRAAAQASQAAVSAEEITTPTDEESLSLLLQHEQNERGMIRGLLDFGLRPWDEQSLVADYILTETRDLIDLVDNKRLLKILDIYKTWYEQGLEPTAKNFLYHEDQELSTLAVSIMNLQYDLSPNWSEVYEGKIMNPDEQYKEDVLSTMGYLKLRKIKRLMEQNQQDFGKAQTDEEMRVIQQTHMHLKEMERAIVKDLGTVIMK
jgi:DNA primase